MGAGGNDVEIYEQVYRQDELVDKNLLVGNGLKVASLATGPKLRG